MTAQGVEHPQGCAGWSVPCPCLIAWAGQGPSQDGLVQPQLRSITVVAFQRGAKPQQYMGGSCSEEADGCCYRSVAAWSRPSHLPPAVEFPTALGHMAVK